MRITTRTVLMAVAPLIATGCQKTVKVENVVVTNDTDMNAMAPTDDGMVNYAATDANAVDTNTSVEP